MTREGAIKRAEALVAEDGIPRFVFHDAWPHEGRYWIARREFILIGDIPKERIVWDSETTRRNAP